MKERKIETIIAIIMMCIILFIVFVFSDDKDLQKQTVNTITDAVTDMIADNESTTEIPTLTENDEQILEVQETEAEKFKEQGDIAYNGSDKTPSINVGNYAGLTYYSQIDSRWKNKIYSSIGDSSQTIGNSGCGATSAAMIVSSIRGTITPDTMADLFVKYGYRSANSGTYWSAFRWIADVFNIEYQETSNLDAVINLLKNNNYVVASCGNGLFTYGGHFIVIVGIEGDTLKIYDPYLYYGKFDTSTRKGKATINGNTVYVSIDNFRRYANAQGFFCFKNDRQDIKDNTTTPSNDNDFKSNIIPVEYKVKVIVKTGLNIRSGASTKYSKIGGYTNNSVVTILAENNGWGKTNLGWICLDYTTKIYSTDNSYSIGNYKVIANVLNVRTGAGINYKIKIYNQLTANARSQNKRLGNYYTNGYRKGVICTVTKINGNWGYTNSGWICLDYCIKI